MSTLQWVLNVANVIVKDRYKIFGLLDKESGWKIAIRVVYKNEGEREDQSRLHSVSIDVMELLEKRCGGGSV